MQEEEWKLIDLPKVEKDRYWVSNFGRVWSDCYVNHNYKEKFLRNSYYAVIADNGNGYKNVGLRVSDGTMKRFYVHRLVAQHFIPNPENLPQVGHRDDDKTNNYEKNLYWCTGSQNIKDSHKTGASMPRRQHGPLISWEEDIVYNAYYDVVVEGKQITSTAKEYGMSRTTLSSIVNKRARQNITDNIDLLLDNPTKL